MGETEEKLLKAAQEVNQLRVEESNLRQENLQLRVCFTIVLATKIHNDIDIYIFSLSLDRRK